MSELSGSQKQENKYTYNEKNQINRGKTEVGFISKNQHFYEQV
ncbi:hypothetical protein [Sphingobacterium chungjuense]|nr:hypothetical protein [Sphingobacterium chungjuense]